MSFRFATIFIMFVMLCVGTIRLFSRVLERTHHGIMGTQKPLVVCTTNIIADAVREIGAPYIDVVALMGPEVDPHSYRARERDVHALAAADLILYHGLHLEGKMGELFDALASKMRVAAGTASLPRKQLRESPFAGIYDPHVWHDVSLWKLVVHEIVRQLMLLDEHHAQQYQHAAVRYTNELDELDAYVHQAIEKIPEHQRILITAHDAFFYFGRAYGLHVIGLQGISTDIEASAYDVAQLIATIKKYKVPALFLESTVLPRSIQAVQQALAAEHRSISIAAELYSDALGISNSGADTYISMIRHNVDTMVNALTTPA